MIENGMSQGVEDSFSRLDELVARLQPAGTIN